MAESGKIERRQYTEEFQLEVVRLADSVGLNAAADRLGVPRATVGNWARRRRKVGFAGHAKLQEARADAWRAVVYTASQLLGQQAIDAALQAATRVRDIRFSRPWLAPERFEKIWTRVQHDLGRLGVSLTSQGQFLDFSSSQQQPPSGGLSAGRTAY